MVIVVMAHLVRISNSTKTYSYYQFDVISCLPNVYPELCDGDGGSGSGRVIVVVVRVLVPVVVAIALPSDKR